MSWPQVSQAPGAIDAQIGKYRLLTELGSGGMAHVYLAVVRGPSGFIKLSVIKLLKDGGGLADEPDSLAMFLNEARLSARLNHPNVVQTFEVGEDRGRHYIVMEYLEGQSFDRLLRRVRQGKAGEAPALPCLLRALCDALAGLHYAHELRDYDGAPLGVVHRDVSASNVFVTYEGQAKVVDFGIAKARRSTNLTRTGALKGTLRYMAPEQVRGQGVDRRADIFAAGVLLWEAAAGSRMWSGHDDVVILHRLMTGDVPRLRESAPGAPEGLAIVCDRALAADPADRYPTAQAMRADLERLLDRFGPAGQTSALAALTSDVFRADREQLRALIERQLSVTLRSAFDLPASPALASTLPAPPPARSGGARDEPPPPSGLAGMVRAELGSAVGPPGGARAGYGSSPGQGDAVREGFGSAPGQGDAVRDGFGSAPGPLGAMRAELGSSPGQVSATYSALPAVSTAARGVPALNPALLAAPPRGRSRRGPLVMGAVLVPLVASGVWARDALQAGAQRVGARLSGLGATTSAALAPAAPPPASAGPAAEIVELRIDTGAVEAHVSLDGRPLGKTPLRAAVPRGGEHQLRLEAPGHQALTRRVSLERDVMVELVLPPAAASASPPSPPSAPGAPRPRSAPAALATAAPPSPPEPPPRRKRAAPPLDKTDPYQLKP
ncbi:MAG TPA: protein kinase [Polyangiaceae bacterium]|nr:protein kinase [Polyangiaceae bacterium]